MARYTGRKVKKQIIRFYTRKKHYSTKRAKYIAGAVAFEEHKERVHRHVKHHKNIFTRYRRHRR